MRETTFHLSDKYEGKVTPHTLLKAKIRFDCEKQSLYALFGEYCASQNLFLFIVPLLNKKKRTDEKKM